MASLRPHPIGGQALKAGGLIGRFPTLQIKITDAENKRCAQMEPAATGSKPSTVSKPFRQSSKPANEIANRCGAPSPAPQAKRGSKAHA
jgi:hypothetical protein